MNERLIYNACFMKVHPRVLTRYLWVREIAHLDKVRDLVLWARLASPEMPCHILLVDLNMTMLARRHLTLDVRTQVGS